MPVFTCYVETVVTAFFVHYCAFFSQWGFILRRPSGRRFYLLPKIVFSPDPETGNMEKTENMPLWVYLAFSSIPTRKAALLLILACVVFSVYCIPWRLLLPDLDWVAQLFLIEDWSWFAMMVAVTFWYWLSLRWVDNNSGWPDRGQQKGQSPSDV